ncbi:MULTISPECIES: hypothetical protein [unclassified Gilliamella]|uniref:hypothetical protein n=1 Tax=unclassified Gilliamella TaxID=2685620 RepID=UPI0013273C98|nr:MULTISPECIES: hypothetical protein [unclassified Gilliamella]MWN32195.1 hypothetical protein [Gilliamella sp. Pra-s60]MWP29483.1 hypothetical protein [Gilliamella sp. Pra-s54]
MNEEIITANRIKNKRKKTRLLVLMLLTLTACGLFYSWCNITESVLASTERKITRITKANLFQVDDNTFNCITDILYDDAFGYKTKLIRYKQDQEKRENCIPL